MWKKRTFTILEQYWLIYDAPPLEEKLQDTGFDMDDALLPFVSNANTH